MMSGDSSQFDVSVDEAFLYGVLAGQQKILEEIEDMIREGNTDPLYLKAYINARLKSVSGAKDLADYLKKGGREQ